jgi:hypothetical protein
MADEADRADQEVETSLQEALYRIRSVKKAQPAQPRGECFFCEAALDLDKRFCDSDCASDYEREERIRRSTGR